MHRADGLIGHRLVLAAGKAGDAEVHHLDGAVRQQHDVLRLDVPVHDALLMGVLQRRQNLCDEVQRLFIRQRLGAVLHIFFQRDAVDILHHDKLELVRHADIVYLYDIGMIQHRNRLGFVFKPPHKILVAAAFLPQDLHRHKAVFQKVGGFVDVGHAAGTDQLLQLVTAVQFFPDQIIHCSPPLPLLASAGP